MHEFSKKRSLEDKPSEWTAHIPPLPPTGEMPRPNIRYRNPNLGFNRTYKPRPELSPEIKEELLNASKKWLRKYYKNKRNKGKPEGNVVFNDNLGRGKRKRTQKVLNYTVPPKRARKFIKIGSNIDRYRAVNISQMAKKLSTESPEMFERFEQEILPKASAIKYNGKEKIIPLRIEDLEGNVVWSRG